MPAPWQSLGFTIRDGIVADQADDGLLMREIISFWAHESDVLGRAVPASYFHDFSGLCLPWHLITRKLRYRLLEERTLPTYQLPVDTVKRKLTPGARLTGSVFPVPRTGSCRGPIICSAIGWRRIV